MMLFTHYHTDHISGLPMLLTMGTQAYGAPVWPGPRSGEVVGALRTIAPELPFESVSGNCGSGGTIELAGKRTLSSKPSGSIITSPVTLPWNCQDRPFNARAMELDIPKPLGRLQQERP